MEEPECPPVTVEGDWSPAQTKSMKNKLLLYFQSKRKSGGGDCRVETDDGAPKAAVYFKSAEVRERVLAKKNHEVVIAEQTVKLRLTSASTPQSEAEPGNAPAAESIQSVAVVLDNVEDNLSRDLLSMLVENISGLDESGHSLEIIWETNKAVVTFNSPADVEKFLTVSKSNQKLQKYKLTARPLEAAVSVRVESLPPTLVKDMLEMYFEKTWALPDNIVMIPTEQAAIMTFSDPKVVGSICLKQDYVIGSSPVKVYPYYESLGDALYGKERPTWKMPNPFTEKVHPVLSKFLLVEKEFKSINDQMRPFFCSVDLIVDSPEVKLSPLLSFLRQTGLTAQQVDSWMSTTQDAFRQQMSKYTVFECTANAPAWKAAEKDVRLVVGEEATLELDTSKGVLNVAGRADSIKRIRAPVENIVLKAISQIERQTNGVSAVMSVAPAMFFIFTQDGLQKAALDISPEMNLSYDESTQTLTISGLPEEVSKTKSWIMNRNMGMRKKQLNVSYLIEFLKTVDPMDMSQELFTSQGISAIYSIESGGVSLVGSSDNVLVDAENKMKTVLDHQILDVEDQEVLKLPNWIDLKQKLLDTYNSPKQTVVIQTQPGTVVIITVAGFVNPVKDVSRSLKEFIANYSQVQETIRVESSAVVQFIDKKQDWTSIAKANYVKVIFDAERPIIKISGARVHVQKAKSCFQELTSVLFTDNFIVDKPGVKKYFESLGSMFLSTIMTDLSCVVVLRPEKQEEEKQENNEEGNAFSCCKVKTTSGVLVSVSQGDICTFRVDVVVNAANEELQHIGGLAFALLKAAGPELQKISNDYVSRNGKLRTGEAIVTDACRLPCKYVVHAVGPRFFDYDKQTAVMHLKVAVKNSLFQAEKFKCSTIALPAISSGVYGFPVDLCANTIAQAVREYCDSPGSLGSLTKIHLVDNNVSTVRALATAINSEFADLGPTMTTPQQAAGASGGYQLQGRDERQSLSHRGGQSSERGRQGGQQQRGQGRKQGGRGAGAAGADFRGDLQGNRGAQSTRRHPKPEGPGGLGGTEQYTAEGLRIILCKGNIQEQTTEVIVNTIADNMNLSQGAVSKALLKAAGPGLQAAIRSEAKVPKLNYADVVVTDSFNLKCQKVFHAVCPHWDNGAGQAQEELVCIIRFCLEEAEKHQMKSLSFPAIGTGNLNFPRDLVSNVLLNEIHVYSSRRNPRHLKEVALVVHPSDTQTVDSFTKEFQRPISLRKTQHEAQGSPLSQSQPSTASFSQVSSPSTGVYRMQMGQLTLEVSSGDITKEACDAIINSSNSDFNLYAGVSKAILDSAGPTVLEECTEIVNAPAYQRCQFIVTAAGNLPCKNIVHIFLKDSAIKDMIYSVLKICEENRFNSVAFPALGTGQGGAKPAQVADDMVEAVLEFVRKKHPSFVRNVKILIFQANMVTEFHNSMKKREGEKVEEKGFLAKIKSSFLDFVGFGEKEPSTDVLVLEKEEFESTVFQLCADNKQAVSEAKKRIEELIVKGQTKRPIKDPFISQLSRADMEQLHALQRELTVSIYLERGSGFDQEPTIHLEGLTADVYIAEAAIRDVIRKVERAENLKSKALMMMKIVEWQYDDGSRMKSFDMYTNAELEEALNNKKTVQIKINNQQYKAIVTDRKAVLLRGSTEVELLRNDLKEENLPSYWDDMKNDFLKKIPVAAGSTEYIQVETELQNNGLTANIISIERVQNKTLWKSYQLLKKQMEVKNKHTNNERQLFHGTGAHTIDLIDKHGFSRSYAGQHGAMYGNGSYFSVNPVYSANNYAPADMNGVKRMYMARVLIGEFTKGQKGLKAPPPKGNAADLYDTVVDQTPNPSMFIVFNDVQAYPEYLITFT